MFSYQKRKDATLLLEMLNDKDNAFLSTIQSLNSSYHKAVAPRIRFQKEVTQDAFYLLTRALPRINLIIDNFSLRNIYRSLDAVESFLENSPLLTSEAKVKVQNLKAEMDKFSILFAEISSLDADKRQAADKLFIISNLLVMSNRIYNLLDLIKFGIAVYLGNSEESKPQSNNEKIEALSLALSSEMTLNSFSRKLISIDVIYKEVCDLLNISISEYPLTVNNIESGSLLAQISGNKEVITIVGGFVTAGALYIFDNYTDEGQLSGIPKKVDQIESVLQLTEKLDKAGIDTVEMKENIAKASVTISKQLNTLLEGEAEVAVNNDIFSIAEVIKDKMLTGAKQFVLNAPISFEYAPVESDEESTKPVVLGSSEASVRLEKLDGE